MILRCGDKIWNRWREVNPETRPDLGNANLEDADLGDANLGRAYLGDANLRGANLVGADLRGADFRGANLGGADLRGADFRGAYLRDAYLGRAYLGKTNLGGADLRNADLEYSNLVGVDFRGADLRDAYLGRADLGDANLGGANLGGAFLLSTHLHAVDLRLVNGLEEVTHVGPSPVSSQTLERSQGQIPEEFLKDCGLKDWEILAAKLHDPNLRPDEITDILYKVDQVRGESPIVPLSVFISYTRKDQSFVERVERQFDKDGIRSWRDVHDVVAGPLEVQVDRAIGLQRVTLLVLSEDSVKSDWVEWEATRAREVEQERDGKYVLCPVALDDSWKKCRWSKVVRTQIEKYAILDFSRWGSDSEFETQYERLKKGLGIYYANKELEE